MKSLSFFIMALFLAAGASAEASSVYDRYSSVPADSCEEVIIPSSFTPNGDGVNDELHIYCECAFNLQYSVYSRWGNLIFETSEPGSYWDGTKDGDIVEPGVYYISYKGVYLSGEEFEGSGNVTLMR
ncbi:MAG: gliding motility-associated C-terminal domain-containing protein [Bacteroidales bacterium]|nr:gliding motility-associated C-terminal domain-containing protein [Bacteroidales bacterium]